jgi:Zn-dependent M16 (insulinase) family peptidase
MTTLYGFELTREQYIPELNTQARLYRHVKTGAGLLSMLNNEENKVFMVAFCTPPSDSTGVPHIMEHSVLCGSRKYPVKEPFVELLKGSLKTFVNAMTFPDKTLYPVASQNLQDFYNLIDVYLDAVFYPRLTPFTLHQEGWHYELDDLNSPLVYKGVVFNEMKGAYSDPDNLLGRYVQQSIFPDNTYGVDSGGDPAVIPDLTFPQFKRFHDTYYHPSNARFVFYGDDPEEERLRILDDYLKDFEAIRVNATVALQPRFAAPRRLVYTYAVGQDGQDGEDAAKAIVTTNWMLNEHTDTEATLALDILNHILVDTPASPLRKALIDSGLGEDLAGGGLDTDLRQSMFSTGLKGVALADIDKVEPLVLDTLRALAKQGIDPDMIEAAVNTIEFARRENNTGSFPRGIVVGWMTMRTWIYGGDPFAPLLFEAPLAAIKARLKPGSRYFENLIMAHLLENPHRTTVILKPDPELQQRQEAAEKERLAQVRAGMSREELQQVLDETLELKRRQETPDPPEALATIPSLKLDDLDKENKLIPLAVQRIQGARVLVHDLFTNGIVYLDVGFNLRVLPQEYLPYLGLFGRALLEMGTETEDFVKLSQRIGRQTGGIYSSNFTSMMHESNQSATWTFLRGKATVERAGDLLAILRDVLLTVRFDNRERFRQMVLEEKASQEAGLVPGGHAIVRTRLQAHFNEADWAAEQMEGVSYLLFIRQLADAVENDWPSVLDKLETIRRLLVDRQAMIANVTLDAPNWAVFEPQLAEFLGALPGGASPFVEWTPAYEMADEGLTIPAQVNYVGKAADLYKLGYKPHGSVVPILNYLRATWLWERVRVHGGAYGAYALFDWRSGAFAFLSYRDPNLQQTLDNYDQSAKFLCDLDLSQAELVKAIVGAIGMLDAYQLPDAKGFTSMLRLLMGESDNVRQQRRDEILSTTQADFRAFADVLEQVNAHGSVVVLGSPDAIARANAARPDWLKVVKVL